MKFDFLYKIRSQKYLVSIFVFLLAFLCVSVFLALSVDLNRGDIVACFFQCLIALLSISVAGAFVSLPFRWVRSKILLLIVFLVLLCYGIILNSEINYGPNVDRLKLLIHPFNTTLASFFPSRGDYLNFEDSKDNICWYHHYLIFHLLTYFYAAWLVLFLFGRKALNNIAVLLLSKRSKNLIWGYSEGALELARDMKIHAKLSEPVFVLDESVSFGLESGKTVFNKLTDEEFLVVNTNYVDFVNNDTDASGGWFRCLHRWLNWHKYMRGYRLYFITENQDFNVKYALEALRCLSRRKNKIKGKMHLYVRSEQQGIDVFFQKQLNNGLSENLEVHILNQSDITARLFVEKHPILDLAKRTNPRSQKKWLEINNETLDVKGDVNILLLGLGWTGLEMLKKQVCDAQYIGDYKINVVVVDKDYSHFHGRYQYIVQEAARFGVNICINPLVWLDDKHCIKEQWLKYEKCGKKCEFDEMRIDQSNSDLFYEWLAFRNSEYGMPNILCFNRIIVALGADELNVNTALQLVNFRCRYLGSKEALDTSLCPEPIFAHVRDKERYSYYDDQKDAPIRIFGSLKSIYNVINLLDEEMDKIAKLVNYVYSKYDVSYFTVDELKESLDNNEAEKCWAKCSIFDKDSSRAVAMNLPNVLKITGGMSKLPNVVKDDTKQRNVVENISLIERLMEMEHKRWNAFHYMRGIGTWNISDVVSVPDISGKVKAKGKLYFNDALVRHICLIDYSELDKATKKVNDLGNEGEDFKASDKRIVSHFSAFCQFKKDSTAGKSDTRS